MRKVIQLCHVPETGTSRQHVLALCDDGTIWYRFEDSEEDETGNEDYNWYLDTAPPEEGIGP